MERIPDRIIRPEYVLSLKVKANAGGHQSYTLSQKESRDIPICPIIKSVT